MASDIVAFFSYSHFDDEHDSAYLNNLRARIESELRAQSGRDITIFYDRRDIAWGETWKSRIDGAIEESAFLVPIITPSFLTSAECRRELEVFAEQEQRYNHHDLILPIYYIAVPALEGSEPTTDAIVELIKSRQYLDWRALRYTKLNTVKARTAIGKLAKQFLSALANRQEDKTPIQEAPHGEARYANVDTPMVARILAGTGESIDVGVRAERQMMLRTLVSESSSFGRDNPNGRALYRLLVTPEIAKFLARPDEMDIEVDSRTACIPWELMEEGESQPSQAPWAVRSRLLRRFRRIEVPRVADETRTEHSALIIGEPATDGLLYPPLPGARAEAVAVGRCLVGGLEQDGLTAKVLVGSESDATAIMSALLERDWRIVHVAGHGLVRDSDSGVALSRGSHLGPREFASMPRVPELVFLNCCHLPALTPSEPGTSSGAYNYSRPLFAAIMGESLLAIGVSCVVVAGWPVDDQASTIFADRFYVALMQGQCFRDAVAAAREAVFNIGSTNTWGAFQCYGKPNWTLRD